MVDIVFTGGGTAGHVTPNLALIPDLQNEGYTVAYIGQANSIEEQLCKHENIDFYAISAGKLRRYFDWQNFTDLFRILFGLVQAFSHLIRHRPYAVFSKGGFVSCPVVWAAWLLRIPVMIHESDISPGLANKLSIPFARKICYSFPETAAYLPKHKSIQTGLPVRDFLNSGNSVKGRAFCGFQTDKPVLLVIGGSMGAVALNELVRENLEELLNLFNICHICGQQSLSKDFENKDGYAQFGYLGDELADVLASTEIVLSRAGATSIFEFLFLKKPSVLVPLPLSASRGDQILNARSFEKLGYAKTIDQESLLNNPKLLVELLTDCFDKRVEYITNMEKSEHNQAKQKIISLLKQYL